MMGMQNNQIDIFDFMIFDKLVPKDHLLIKVDETVDFSFVREQTKSLYSDIGRPSYDPETIFKMQLLEFIYNISDVEVCKRSQTDIAFRWFLRLGLDDTVPDDTTISDFRCNRLTPDIYDGFFNEIVKQCIDANLIKTHRFIVDSTNVDANVNFPSRKKLIEKAFNNVLKELKKTNSRLADALSQIFNLSIQNLYVDKDKVRSKEHASVTLELMNYLYLKTYDLLEYKGKFYEKYELCYDLVSEMTENGKSKIISIVDPDARVAHKTRGNMKRGYKDHIIIDEDSEIILASKTTPFNVPDQNEFISIVKKVETEFKIKSTEISADTVYGTIENRAYLLDHDIIANIRLYSPQKQAGKSYDKSHFNIAKDLKKVICKNNVCTMEYRDRKDKEGNKVRIFKFKREDCDQCIYRKECLKKNKYDKISCRFRSVEIPERYDALLNDQLRNSKESFRMAQNKRYKVERRFATLVRNHGLRRSRYIRLEQTTKHVTMANLACNIIRMVNIIGSQQYCAAKILN